jgi:hypothetical protein
MNRLVSRVNWGNLTAEDVEMAGAVDGLSD